MPSIPMENLYYYFVNDDITTAILSRLPVKILLKLRSVSKSWRDMIDSSGFRNLHVKNQVSNNESNIEDDEVLLQPMPRPDKYLSGQVLKMISIMILDFPSYKDFLRNNDLHYDRVVFSGQAHGLICLYKKNSRNPIGLCNPQILPAESRTPVSCIYNKRWVGLGYDDVEQDFKVVQISTHFPDVDVEVYSRKQDKWREVGDHPLHRDIFIIGEVKSCSPCGGAYAHWFAIDRSETRSSRYIIVSFDMRSEALETIEIPRFESATAADSPGVLAMEDSLIVFLSDRDIDNEEEVVIIMWECKLVKKPRGEWIKKGRLGAFDIGRAWPLMWWKSGELVLKLYSNKTKRYKIVYYDCCSGQIVRCIHDYNFCTRRLLQYNRPTFTSP